MNQVIRGSRSTLVVTGGATVVNSTPRPLDVILVDHALVRTFYKERSARSWSEATRSLRSSVLERNGGGKLTR